MGCYQKLENEVMERYESCLPSYMDEDEVKEAVMVMVMNIYRVNILEYACYTHTKKEVAEIIGEDELKKLMTTSDAEFR